MSTLPVLQCDTAAARFSSSFVQAMLDESAETPSIQQLVDGSVTTVAQMPAAAFPLADMLVSLCGQDSGKNKQQVFKGLVQHLIQLGSAQVKFLLLSSLPTAHRSGLRMCMKRLEFAWQVQTWSVQCSHFAPVPLLVGRPNRCFNGHHLTLTSFHTICTNLSC